MASDLIVTPNLCVLYILSVLFYYVICMLYTLQGCKSGISHLPVVPVTLDGSSQNISVPPSTKINSPISVVQTSFTSSANKVDLNGRTSEYEDITSHNGPQASSNAQTVSNSILHTAHQLTHEATGKLYEIVGVFKLRGMIWNGLGIHLLPMFPSGLISLQVDP